jgi:hypothetical protein
MITITQNPNLNDWFQILTEGRLFDEIRGKAKAMRVAKALAEKERVRHLNVDGEILEIKKL